jgi:Cu/Zn superoxide dismutase
MKTFVPVGAFIASLLLAACGGTNKEGLTMFPQVAGLGAQLRSPSSAATGVVRIYDYRDGVQVQLSVNNLFPGLYRIAIHEKGNCSSPNLFSAGPPWAPAGFDKPPGELLPGFLANPEGNQNSYVAYIKGVTTDGPQALRGKSVVIHYGNSVDQAFPGQPNNRMACGVLQANDPG